MNLNNIWFVLVLFFSVVCSDSVIAEMPQSAKEDLRTILSQPLFQPRAEHKSVVAQLKERVVFYAQQKLSEFVSWLREIMPILPQSTRFNATLTNLFDRIGQFFGWLFSVIYQLGQIILWGVIAGLALFVCLKLYVKYLRIRPEALAGTDDDSRLVHLNIQDHLNDPPRLLEAMRLILRAQFDKRYGFSSTLTDREVLRRVSRAELNRDLFRDIASSFELASFGRQMPPAERIQELFRNNQQLFLETR